MLSISAHECLSIFQFQSPKSKFDALALWNGKKVWISAVSKESISVSEWEFGESAKLRVFKRTSEECYIHTTESVTLGHAQYFWEEE